MSFFGQTTVLPPYAKNTTSIIGRFVAVPRSDGYGTERFIFFYFFPVVFLVVVDAIISDVVVTDVLLDVIDVVFVVVIFSVVLIPFVVVVFIPFFHAFNG